MANQLAFTVILPMTFLSNVFVPPETLPGLPAPDRGVEPDQRAHRGALRALGQPEPLRSDSFPAEEPVLLTLIWVAVFVAVFAPLAVIATAR